MKSLTNKPVQREICRLEWLINSNCDYACKGCRPVPTARPDLELDARLEALRSFVDFAASTESEAQISFSPRQAAYTKSFTAVLEAVRDFKRQGRLGRVTCGTRGDLPTEKIRLFSETGVDVCRLTIDGPEALQDDLRRPGSFRDTLGAMREAKEYGLKVVPLMIVMARNAPYVADTLKLLLDEGHQGLALQVAIQGDAGQGERRASLHPDPDSPFNRLLTPVQYRAVLVDVLRLLDSLGGKAEDARSRFLRETPLGARLFYELGRLEEYEQSRAGNTDPGCVQFVLKPDGSVLPGSLLSEIGAFPGGRFADLFATGHPLRWFESAESLRDYEYARQREWLRCASCPVARYCPPLLVGWQDRRLFYAPDPHCWVTD